MSVHIIDLKSGIWEGVSTLGQGWTGLGTGKQIETKLAALVQTDHVPEISKIYVNAKYLIQTKNDRIKRQW